MHVDADGSVILCYAEGAARRSSAHFVFDDMNWTIESYAFD